MKREELIDQILNFETSLRKTGVDALYVFGSFARDEGKSNSDIDILVDAPVGKRIDLLAVSQGRRILEMAFPGREISYSTRRSIVPLYLPYIDADAVRVF